MRVLVLILAAVSCAAQTIPLDWMAAMNRIRADSMRGNLSFLASDLLEGRATPSRGLDIAAEFIAAQFRRDGLEPGGNDGYFHTSNWAVLAPNRTNFAGRLRIGRETIVFNAENAVPLMKNPIDLRNIPLVAVEPDFKDIEGHAILIKAQHVAGRVKQIAAAKPALVVVLDPEGKQQDAVLRSLRPYRPSGKPPLPAVNWLFVRFDSGAIPGDAEISIKAGAAEPRPFTLKNVAGILRGSDPVLKDTYLFVTAHYDHLGMLPPGDGDRIFNGANDDGSGAVSVVELAESLSLLPHRPKRSIVFMAVGGEERGFLGSRAFLQDPSVPLPHIIGDINLEHLGRTDVDGIVQLAKLNVTGFDFTDMSAVFTRAGKDTGVEYYRHEKYSDPFFPQSDNLAFAEKGIPSHTVSNGYEFPDYHATGDHWDKVDYNNMEKLVRSIVLAVLRIADSGTAPRWNESNEKTQSFRKARMLP